MQYVKLLLLTGSILFSSVILSNKGAGVGQQLNVHKAAVFQRVKGEQLDQSAIWAKRFDMEKHVIQNSSTAVVTSTFSKREGGEVLMLAAIQKINLMPTVTVLPEDEERIIFDRKPYKPKSFNKHIEKKSNGKGVKDGGEKGNVKGGTVKAKKLRNKVKKLFRKGMLFVLISKL